MQSSIIRSPQGQEIHINKRLGETGQIIELKVEKLTDVQRGIQGRVDQLLYFDEPIYYSDFHYIY